MVGFDESIGKEEIGEFLTEIGSCEYDEINIGDIRPMRNGLYMTWVPASSSGKAGRPRENKTRMVDCED